MVKLQAPSVKRIVIIDDEPAFGELVRGVAEGCGYSATFTTDPATFKDNVVELDPSIIVLDLSMPGTDGIELLRYLSGIGSGAGILIVSGFDRRVTETATSLGRELGLSMLGPLAKPIRVDELRKLLAGNGSTGTA
jgi:DNA-binding response OmpR family regulator